MNKDIEKRNVQVSSEQWEFESPFAITGYKFTAAKLVVVTIREGEWAGRGEAAGVYYLGETTQSVLDQIASVTPALEAGATREDLLSLLPAGGARNAIDCALWDLEAKQTGATIWEMTDIKPGRIQSVLTIGIDSPRAMAQKAALLESDMIKVKLSHDDPLKRITAVRKARPDAEIIVDVNQGWTFEGLVEFAPRFRDLGIAMIEQPLPRGADAQLEDYESPIPLCADESCLHSGEFEQTTQRYSMINIKLDKAGGLTEALALVKLARQSGVELMVGNMMGTSLSMAPGYVIAQSCRFVDLDGPTFLTRDREHHMTYSHGFVSQPTSSLWG